MPRIVSNEMDKAADEMLERVVPTMVDAMARVRNLEIDYDKGQWETILYTITDKLPRQMGKLPMSKEDRLELLGVIDILDRTVREKGSARTAKTMIETLVTMVDLMSAFRRAMRLRVKQGGLDITEEIFGDK